MWNVSAFDHPDFLLIWGLGLTRLHLFLSGLCLSFIYFILHGLVGLIFTATLGVESMLGLVRHSTDWAQSPLSHYYVLEHRAGLAGIASLKSQGFAAMVLTKAQGYLNIWKGGLTFLNVLYFFLLFKSSLKPLLAPDSINMAHSANQPWLVSRDRSYKITTIVHRNRKI